MKFRRDTKGFTLIELLVVISIIGMLSSVVLAALGGARDSAYDSHLVSDIHQLDIAMTSYFSDHNSYPLSPETSSGYMNMLGLNNILVTQGYMTGPINNDAFGLYIHKCQGPQHCRTPSGGNDPGGVLLSLYPFVSCGVTYMLDNNPENDGTLGDNSDDAPYSIPCSGQTNPDNTGCWDAEALIFFGFKRPNANFKYISTYPGVSIFCFK
jgi:prepilin-type N-terminal cleavage/methylation domain-containing protein